MSLLNISTIEDRAKLFNQDNQTKEFIDGTFPILDYSIDNSLQIINELNEANIKAYSSGLGVKDEVTILNYKDFNLSDYKRIFGFYSFFKFYRDESYYQVYSIYHEPEIRIFHREFLQKSNIQDIEHLNFTSLILGQIALNKIIKYIENNIYYLNINNL